jgi:pimeloyl-ACP methyl ester carboxylesterase
MARNRIIHAWDGLTLHIQEWGEGPLLPLLCLPGLVRTTGDFADFAGRYGGERRIVSLDYAGRGESGRSQDVARYRPENCLRDVLDVCAALHLHRVVVIGTSFGGLLAMGIAVMRPGLLAGVLLNDVGPELGAAGAAFLRRFIADDPALPDLAQCAAHLRQRLPYLSLTTEAQWQHFAHLTYRLGPDGKYHPRWDTAIAELLDPPVRDLWPLFDALVGIPVLLVRGTHSNLLLAPAVEKMRMRRSDMEVADIEGVGHAPTLAEPASIRAIDRFLLQSGAVACASPA